MDVNINLVWLTRLHGLALFSLFSGQWLSTASAPKGLNHMGVTPSSQVERDALAVKADTLEHCLRQQPPGQEQAPQQHRASRGSPARKADGVDAMPQVDLCLAR